MSLNTIDSKTIDDLQELGKLTGSEKTIVSNGVDTKKVSMDTIVGYTVSRLNGTTVPTSLPGSSYSGNGVIFIPEGEEIAINNRTPGCFYLEETKQTSIRAQVSLPMSIKVNGNLGLIRVGGKI